MSPDRAEEQAELQSLRAKLQRRDATIAKLRDEIEQLKADVESLSKTVKDLLRNRSGRPTIPEGQLTLFSSDSVEADTSSADPTEESSAENENNGDEDDHRRSEIEEDAKAPRDDEAGRKGGGSRARKKLDLSALPRDIVTHELPPEERRDPETGVALVPIGTKVSEELDYVRAQLRVIEHHRTIYGPAPEVAQERQIAPVDAPLPPRAIEGSVASAGLLAQLLIQKYGYHLPLYRQEDVFKQAGVRLSRQTLCDWVMRAAFELRPIANALMRQIQSGPVMALDDTPVKCQRRDGNGFYQGYLWTFVNPAVDGVAYRYTPSRESTHIEKFLVDSIRFLVGDGYSGHFSAVRDAELDIKHGGCWSHVFRKFRDAIPEAKRTAKGIMRLIKQLFELEEQAMLDKLSPQRRLDLRRERARTILAQILSHARGWKDAYSGGGNMATAMGYMTNQWKHLKCFLLDGSVPIHNNACENAIRPIAVGRRNWLFVGSDRGGEAAAVIYTLLASCRLADVDAWCYLRDVLTRIATHPARQIADLVPARWAEIHAGELDRPPVLLTV